MLGNSANHNRKRIASMHAIERPKRTGTNRRFLIWNGKASQIVSAKQSDVRLDDVAWVMDLDNAIHLFEQQTPNRSTTFSQTQLAQLMGASFSTLRQFLAYDLLPIAGSAKPRKGNPRRFTWEEGLIVTLVGEFWHRNVGKEGVRAIGDFLADHIDELSPTMDPVGVD